MYCLGWLYYVLKWAFLVSCVCEIPDLWAMQVPHNKARQDAMDFNVTRFWEKQGTWTLSELRFYWCKKRHDQKPEGRGFFYLLFHKLQTTRQDHTVGTEREAMEESCLLASSPGLSRLGFYTAQVHLSRGGTTRSDGSPHTHIVINQENTPQICLQATLVESFLSWSWCFCWLRPQGSSLSSKGSLSPLCARDVCHLWSLPARSSDQVSWWTATWLKISG